MNIGGDKILKATWSLRWSLLAALGPLVLFAFIARPVLDALIPSCAGQKDGDTVNTLSACAGIDLKTQIVAGIDFAAFVQDIALRYGFGIPVFALIVISLICLIASIACIIDSLGPERCLFALVPAALIAGALIYFQVAGTNNVRVFLVDEIFGLAPKASAYVSDVAQTYKVLSKRAERFALLTAVFMFFAVGAISACWPKPVTLALRRRLGWFNVLAVLGVAMFVLVVLATRSYLKAPIFLVMEKPAKELVVLVSALGGYWAAVTSLMLALSFVAALIAINSDLARLAQQEQPNGDEKTRRTWLEDRGLYISTGQIVTKAFAALVPIISNVGFDLVAVSSAITK